MHKEVYCDRCGVTDATVTIRCWYGCEHQQCSSCAIQTRTEAQSFPDEKSEVDKYKSWNEGDSQLHV